MRDEGGHGVFICGSALLLRQKHSGVPGQGVERDWPQFAEPIRAGREQSAAQQGKR